MGGAEGRAGQGLAHLFLKVGRRVLDRLMRLPAASSEMDACCCRGQRSERAGASSGHRPAGHSRALQRQQSAEAAEAAEAQERSLGRSDLGR